MLCIYLPPDSQRWAEAHAHLVRVLDFVRSRYKSFGLIAFGDLNLDILNDPSSTRSKKWDATSRAYNIQTRYVEDNGSFTRAQGDKVSYIDYFFTSGVRVCRISLGTRFGQSDHLLVACTVEGFDPTVRHRRQFLSKKKAQVALSKLLDNDHDADKLLSLPAAELFQELSRRLRSSATIYEPKSMNFFRAIKTVEDELKQIAPNWKKVRRVVLSCNRTEFLLLLEEIDALRRGDELKEYYNKVSSILKVRKVGLSVQEIENPSLEPR